MRKWQQKSELNATSSQLASRSKQKKHFSIEKVRPFVSNARSRNEKATRESRKPPNLWRSKRDRFYLPWFCASRQLRRSLKSEEDEGAWEIDKQNRFLPFICVSICQIQLKEENDMKKSKIAEHKQGFSHRLLNWVLGETFRLQNPGFRGVYYRMLRLQNIK